MSRAQDIVDDILQGERYANSKLFDDKIYADEPIIRTGASAYGRSTVRPQRERRVSMPAELLSLRRLARGRRRTSLGYAYSADAAKLFVEQARLVADYEDDYDGSLDGHSAWAWGQYPCYEDMSNHELRCYFAWRTRVRRGETPPAPQAFVRLHAYELIAGIGTEPGEEGLRELGRLAEAYVRDALSDYEWDLFAAWQRDYVVFYGLDVGLLPGGGTLSGLAAVAALRRAEEALLAGEAEVPDPLELLDAMVRLSRYRAERSRMFKSRREDVAWVVSRVFADMVAHCSKRRKTGLVDGWFGKRERVSYTMFRLALYWSEVPHEDASYEVGPYESYTCRRGFWWHVLPSRHCERNKEVGALLHAIDCRLRRATQDRHALKDKPLPKYQGRFVDKRIDELVELRAAEEAARVTIDRSALRSIRSAAERTREALLTDEERGGDEWHTVGEAVAAVAVAPAARVAHEAAGESGGLGINDAGGGASVVGGPEAAESAGGGSLSDGPAGGRPTVGSPMPQGESALGLDEAQLTLLRAILCGDALDGFDSLFVSLAVDAINEAFLDVLGDTVIEFDGDAPVLVEDYVEDVRALV